MVGCRLIVVCVLFDALCMVRWLLVVCCWLSFVVGCWRLRYLGLWSLVFVGYYLCSLLVVECWLFEVCCLLCVECVCLLLCVVMYGVVGVWCLLLDACYLLLVVC